MDRSPPSEGQSLLHRGARILAPAVQRTASRYQRERRRATSWILQASWDNRSGACSRRQSDPRHEQIDSGCTADDRYATGAL